MIGYIHEADKPDKDGKKTLIPSVTVGSGSVTINGVEKSFEILTTWGQSPLIRYGKKTYVLSWDDICKLAEDAGLFEEDSDV